jgi:hypothetical protein
MSTTGEQHEKPRGAILITSLFLAATVAAFFITYYLLIHRA